MPEGLKFYKEVKELGLVTILAIALVFLLALNHSHSAASNERIEVAQFYSIISSHFVPAYGSQVITDEGGCVNHAPCSHSFLIAPFETTVVSSSIAHQSLRQWILPDGLRPSSRTKPPIV